MNIDPTIGMPVLVRRRPWFAGGLKFLSFLRGGLGPGIVAARCGEILTLPDRTRMEEGSGEVDVEVRRDCACL